MKSSDLIKQVINKEEAEYVVRELLFKFSSEVAFSNILREAEKAKQSPDVVLKRQVTNLFRSLKTRRG